MPAPSPHIGDLESGPSSQPQPSPSPSPSNTTSESQAPPSPQSPSGVRDPLPHTISESQRNNILDAKLDLEKELKKTFWGCASQQHFKSQLRANRLRSLESITPSACFP
ncbi:hypothetical protein OIU78_028042 [Salix suchowensis]|nr:hypothetical protein OIU78_028042 [Salix suchowensis]